jgi:hypothetical protein
MRSRQLEHIVRQVLINEADSTETTGPVSPSAEVLAILTAYFGHISSTCMTAANDAAAAGATAEEILDIILDPACQNEESSAAAEEGPPASIKTAAWAMEHPAAATLAAVGAVGLGILATSVIKKMIKRAGRKRDQLAAIEKIRRRIDVQSRAKPGDEGNDFADLTEEEILAINRANPHAMMVRPGNKIEVRITNPTSKYFIPQTLTFVHHYYVSGKIMDRPYLVGEKMFSLSVPIEGPGLAKDYLKRATVPPNSSNVYLISIEEAIEKASKPAGEKRDMFSVIVPLAIAGDLCLGLAYEDQYRDRKETSQTIRSDLRINRARNRYEMDTIGLFDGKGGR